MKTILIRTLSGSIYITLIITSLIVHPLLFAALTVLLNYIALREFSNIYRQLGVKTSNSWIILNSAFLLISVLIPGLHFQPIYIVFPLIILLVVILISSLYDQTGNPSYALAFKLLGTIYITLPLILLNLIQQISVQENIPITLALFIIIWTNDTFAYLTGLAIGRNKLFPRVSPKKSWEGFIGGLIMGILASMILYYLFPAPGLINWIIFGIFVVVASTFGDFVESALKRTADIKDSGTIMPGHGGILDRIDSLLIVSPVVYILLLILLI